jgi:uncharacterized protein involved in exopolysaccharide biosynthesis
LIPSQPTDSPPQQSEAVLAEISPWHILRFLVRSRRTIALAVVITVALGVAYAFLSPKRYISRFSFSSPAGASSGSQIASLAAQFGMSLGGGGSERSPAYYASLVTSRVVQDRVSAREFVGAEGRRGTIADLVALEGTTPEILKTQMATWLTENVKVEVSTETGIIRVSAIAPAASFAYGIAQAVLEEIHRFNQETRRAQASAERTFIESRAEQAKLALEGAEVGLRRFLERNRQFRDSPELSFEHDRLQREVIMRQQLYTSLNQALQQAQIAEVRDTPLLTIVDEPLLPALPVPKRLPVVVFLSGVLGSLGGLAWAVVRRPPDGGDVERLAAYNEVLTYAQSWIPRRFRRSA